MKTYIFFGCKLHVTTNIQWIERFTEHGDFWTLCERKQFQHRYRKSHLRHSIRGQLP
jgi:hypothetical protein